MEPRKRAPVPERDWIEPRRPEALKCFHMKTKKKRRKREEEERGGGGGERGEGGGEEKGVRRKG